MCLLSLSILGGHDFNSVFAWFALVILIALHFSAFTGGVKSKILWTTFYVLLAIWIFGYIII